MSQTGESPGPTGTCSEKPQGSRTNRSKPCATGMMVRRSGPSLRSNARARHETAGKARKRLSHSSLSGVVQTKEQDHVARHRLVNDPGPRGAPLPGCLVPPVPEPIFIDEP